MFLQEVCREKSQDVEASMKFTLEELKLLWLALDSVMVAPSEEELLDELTERVLLAINEASK